MLRIGLAKQGSCCFSIVVLRSHHIGWHLNAQARVQATAFSPDDKYAFTAAHAERHIVAWYTAASATKKRQQAAGLISLEHSVLHLASHASVAGRQPAVDHGAAWADFQVRTLACSPASAPFGQTLACVMTPPSSSWLLC